MYPGTIVALLSGSDPMTVSGGSFIPGPDSGTPAIVHITCSWYYNGVVNTGTFRQEMLRVSEQANPAGFPGLMGPGDVVTLNSGSCAMTVADVAAVMLPLPSPYAASSASGSPSYEITCMWYYEGVCNTAKFSPEMLSSNMMPDR